MVVKRWDAFLGVGKAHVAISTAFVTVCVQSIPISINMLWPHVALYTNGRPYLFLAYTVMAIFSYGRPYSFSAYMVMALYSSGRPYSFSAHIAMAL